MKIRKRVILAIIITAITIIATNKLWLIYKPMPFDFDISGKGISNIEIQLNKKDNFDFKKIKTQTLTLNLDKSKHATFLIDRAKNPKRLKILFLSNTVFPFTITNMTFNKGVFKINDFENFKVQNATITANKNELLIKPMANNVEITYKGLLDVHSLIDIQVEIFIIILVLTFLLSYKITDYIGDFRSVQKKSRVEIILLVAFFVSLLIPSLYINTDKKVKLENRYLTEWESLILPSGEINFNFGKNFNEWFNDRFFLRQTCLDIYGYIKYYLSSSRNLYVYKDTVLNRKTHWMGNMYTIANFEKLFPKSDLDLATKNVKRLKKVCDDNNVKLYILVAPVKEEINYKDIFDVDLNVDTTVRTKQMINYVEEKTGVPIIFPYDEMKNLAKSNYAYFKTDHHWTDEGSYIAYLKLMDRVKKDFPNIYINTPNDFDYTYSNQIKVDPTYYFDGGTYERLRLFDKSILDTNYKYFTHKNSKKIMLVQKDFKTGGTWRTFYNDIKAPDLFLFGDSFSLNILQSIVYSYKNSNTIYCSAEFECFDLKLFEEDIAKRKPDMVVLCFAGIDRLLLMYKGE